MHEKQSLSQNKCVLSIRTLCHWSTKYICKGHTVLSKRKDSQISDYKPLWWYKQEGDVELRRENFVPLET